MPKKKSEFPAFVYIRIDDEYDQPFLLAEDTVEAHAEIGSEVRVAQYKLEYVAGVRTEVRAVPRL